MFSFNLCNGWLHTQKSSSFELTAVKMAVAVTIYNERFSHYRQQIFVSLSAQNDLQSSFFCRWINGVIIENVTDFNVQRVKQTWCTNCRLDSTRLEHEHWILTMVGDNSLKFIRNFGTRIELPRFYITIHANVCILNWIEVNPSLKFTGISYRCSQHSQRLIHERTGLTGHF